MATLIVAIVVGVATVTATAVGSKDNGSNSDGREHRQQSTESGNEDTVAVATETEPAAAGAATTAAGAPTTAPGIGTDGIAFAITVGAATTAVGVATSAAMMARTAWRFGRGVAHIVQYLPPLLEEAHAPHSQSDGEEEEAMMGGLWVLVVTVVCGVLRAGFVCASCEPLFFCLATKNRQTMAYWGWPESSQ
jgi:hypothetical protein